MTTDDRKQDLTELRRIAETATPGPWHQGSHYIGAGGEPHDPEAHVGQAALLQDAVHMGAFDPLTVLALLDRLERAEKTIAEALAYIDNHWLSQFRPGETGYELRAILAGYEQTTDRENRIEGEER